MPGAAPATRIALMMELPGPSGAAVPSFAQERRVRAVRASGGAAPVAKTVPALCWLPDNTDVGALAQAVRALGSVAYYIDPDRPAHPRSSLLPERMSGRRITVPAVRLADELGGEGAIDLLKMDVEGAEAALLADLARTGRLRQVRNIAVEFHHNLRGAGRLSRTLQLLEDAGFRYTLRARRHGDCASFQNVMVYAGRTEPA
jgi:hypothetical protein